MKQSDIISVVMVAVIGSIFAFVMVNLILGEPQDVKYETVAKISGTVADPDPEVFNYDAINPTVEVYVYSCDNDGDGFVSDEEREACDQKNSGGEIEPTPEEE